MSWPRRIAYPAGPRAELPDETNHLLDWLRQHGEETDTVLCGAGENTRATFRPALDTSGAELRQMAATLDEHGLDAAQFCRQFHQDAPAFGVVPEEVYLVDEFGNYSWPETGFVVDPAAVPWLRAVCCTVTNSRVTADSLQQRFETLCALLREAEVYGIPLTVSRQ